MMTKAEFTRNLEKVIIQLIKESLKNPVMTANPFDAAQIFINSNKKNKTFTISIKYVKLSKEDLIKIKTFLTKEYNDNFIRICNMKINNPGMWNHEEPKVVITFKESVLENQT